jgi:hypothetical protein
MCVKRLKSPSGSRFIIRVTSPVQPQPLSPFRQLASNHDNDVLLGLSSDSESPPRLLLESRQITADFMACAVRDSDTLRFAVGDRVQCRVRTGGWVNGTVEKVRTRPRRLHPCSNPHSIFSQTPVLLCDSGQSAASYAPPLGYLTGTLHL